MILDVPVNNCSVMSWRVFLGCTSTKQRIKCLAQRHNTVLSVRPSFSSQVLYHWATALLNCYWYYVYFFLWKTQKNKTNFMKMFLCLPPTFRLQWRTFLAHLSHYKAQGELFDRMFIIIHSSSVCLWHLMSVNMGESFRINPEFRILRLTSQRKSASKCWIKEIIVASLINFLSKHN